MEADELKKVLHYDPKTGIFTRLISKQRPDLVGKVVKGVIGHVYQRISIGERRYYAHRLAWLYMTGDWPEHQIDHINGDGFDNRWANIRAATPLLNQQNRRGPSKRNTSGYLGVTFSKEKGRWTARIKTDGVYKGLGYYDTANEAAEVYVLAKRKYHAGCTI